MKKRHLGIELLRVVAMMMVIVLHYLDKGHILKPYSESMSPANLFFWFLEAFALMSGNVYILISGYLLAESTWKPNRLVKILCQVYFYTLLIPLFLVALQVVPAREISIYDWAQYILPIGQESYWYITAYVLMFLFSPILAAGAKALTKKQLKGIILALTFFFSIEKTIIPIALTTDHYGYDFGWLLVLFLAAAYIRLHGIPFLEKGKNGWFLFAGSCSGIWLISLISALIGRLGIDTFAKYYVTMPYTHNYFLSMTGAIGLFYGFKNLKMDSVFCEKHAAFSQLIYKIAPFTLGVYLLHEHPVLHYRWPEWLHVSVARPFGMVLLHMVLCVLLVFTCGILTDMLRDKLFSFAEDKFFSRKQETGRKE